MIVIICRIKLLLTLCTETYYTTKNQLKDANHIIGYID